MALAWYPHPPSPPGRLVSQRLTKQRFPNGTRAASRQVSPPLAQESYNKQRQARLALLEAERDAAIETGAHKVYRCALNLTSDREGLIKVSIRMHGHRSVPVPSSHSACSAGVQQKVS